MTNGFRGRYLETMLDAAPEVVESRLSAVLEVATAIAVEDVLALVELILGFDGSRARTAIEQACERQEKAPKVGGDRELRLLAIETARLLLEGKPKRSADALGLALVTSSWNRDADTDLQRLVSSAVSYIRPRQTAMRQPTAPSGTRTADPYPVALENSGIAGANNPVNFSQIQPLLEALHSYSVEGNKLDASRVTHVQHHITIVDERTNVISLCLSRYSESCDAQYSDLGEIAPLAAAYDLANVTRFDLGFRAARYYIWAMLGERDKDYDVDKAIKDLPERVKAAIAQQALVSEITPIMSAVKGAELCTSRGKSLTMALQLYNELLLAKMMQNA
jgi:hypothetical protein